ncbi:hypothetical protein DENSPDRAFT_146398 [Dentipellis sp. KUC8613]|nr:hypothetical protein DENSPDRAFT_146398 [Dentipellis sp. KUC8613]
MCFPSQSLSDVGIMICRRSCAVFESYDVDRMIRSLFLQACASRGALWPYAGAPRTPHGRECTQAARTYANPHQLANPPVVNRPVAVVRCALIPSASSTRAPGFSSSNRGNLAPSSRLESKTSCQAFQLQHPGISKRKRHAHSQSDSSSHQLDTAEHRPRCRKECPEAAVEGSPRRKSKFTPILIDPQMACREEQSVNERLAQPARNRLGSS